MWKIPLTQQNCDRRFNQFWASKCRISMLQECASLPSCTEPFSRVATSPITDANVERAHVKICPQTGQDMSLCIAPRSAHKSMFTLVNSKIHQGVFELSRISANDEGCRTSELTHSSRSIASMEL